jgi:hypothetical protein
MFKHKIVELVNTCLNFSTSDIQCRELEDTTNWSQEVVGEEPLVE